MITLYDFVKRFEGEQINLYVDEFAFENRDTYPPAITFYNTGGDFEVDKFLWNVYDQLGRNGVLSFDCDKIRNTCVSILIETYDKEDLE